MMLNETLKGQILNVAANVVNVELSAKDLFVSLHTQYLKVSNEQHKSLNKEINNYLNEEIKNTVVLNAVKRIARVAYLWADKKVLSHVDKLMYTNIKDTITLLKYVESKHSIEEAKKVRNKLARVNASKEGYNSRYATKIKELKAEYKVVVTEDDKIIEIDPTKAIKVVESSLGKYTIAQLEELRALLDAELKR